MLRERSTYQLIKMSNVYQSELRLDRNPSFWNVVDAKQKEFILKKGDTVLTLTGTVGKRDFGYSVHIKEDDKYLLNQRLVLLREKELESINEFIHQLVSNEKFLDDFFGVAKGGTGNQTNVGIEDVKKISFSFPSVPEQKRIADFFTLIDERIATQNKIIENLETLIKGLNEKLLTKKMRFKDENSGNFPEWEEQELGEVLYYEQPTKYLVNSTEYDDSYVIPVLTAGKTFILGYSNETHGIFSENLPVIIFDDFTTAIKFVDFPFKAKSSAMKILLPKKGVNIYYVFEAMKSIDYTIGGHERHWISKYSKIEIPLPCSEEQSKIANSLTCIDEKIETEKKILAQYEALKRYFLMNLFI